MSIFKLSEKDIDTFILETNPRIQFYSSSLEGSQGDSYVYPRRSSTIKEEKGISLLPFFSDSTDKDREVKIEPPWDVGLRLSDRLQGYLADINEIISIKPYKTIKRLVPEYSGSQEYVNYLKSTISGSLMPYYFQQYTNSEFSYTNYNCVNFISSSTFLNSAIIFPNIDRKFDIKDRATIGFHVNIRNKIKLPRPGTVLHLPGNFSVSVITGTQVDEFGYCEKYGILFQMGSQATSVSYNSPSIVDTEPEGSLAWKFDNVITHNSWHEVTFYWDQELPFEKGTLVIDGEVIQRFGNIENPVIYVEPSEPRNIPHLILGNYNEGPSHAMGDFFSNKQNLSWGLGLSDEQVDYFSGNSQIQPGTSMVFNHSGYFELHDVCISNKILTSRRTKTPRSYENFVFYLSTDFSETTNVTQKLLGEGGTLISLSEHVSGLSTSTPYNLMLAYGSGVHVMNLHNHLRDMTNPGISPHLFRLNVNDYSGYFTPEEEVEDINEFFKPYTSPANLLILPCDDGNFTPRYFSHKEKVSLSNFITNSTEVTTYQTDRFLSDAVQQKTKQNSNFSASDPVFEILKGPTPKPISQKGGPFSSILEGGQLEEWRNNFSFAPTGYYPDRTFPGATSWKFLDESSCQVVIFDVSNLFYGDRIEPETLEISDTSFFGSDGKLSMVIKDDGMGGLYRADCTTKHARFNNVGNVFYDEGIIILKNPSLYFFGKDSFSLKGKGSRNIHIAKFDVTAPRNMVNSSSNPTYSPKLRPSSNPIDYDENMVYISGFNLHDDNFNVVARAKLAQPIMKRDFMKIGFKMKIDF